MRLFRQLQNKISGSSLQKQTKLLLLNTAVGLCLMTGTCILSLMGLKHDYDSSFINQEQKLKQLIIIQNIYSSILANFLKQSPIQEEMHYLLKAWQKFTSIQEEGNYSTRFKGFYAKIFLQDPSLKIQELSSSENQIAEIIERDFAHSDQNDFEEFRNAAFSLNRLLHRAIHLRIEILNLEKQATNSLFFSSLILIICLLSLIILTTLFFSQLIITSIKSLHHALEDAIFQKTKELRKLNDDLQRTIQNEVKQSRQKDQIMYQQARLASIGEMIQNIAHQWRQPLNSLILIIQSFPIKLEHNKLTADFLHTQTQNAIRIAKNMSETIESFRNFFQPNQARDCFGILQAIQECLEILKANLSHNNFSVFIPSREETLIFSYKNAFTQVVLNLINNAKDASSHTACAQGILEISSEIRGEWVVICFRDNAGGIKVKEIEKIFEPYFTTKHKSVGTGIGLYMVKQLIEKQMEGKIIVHNQTWVSKITQCNYYGACFEIMLPRNLQTSP